MTSPFDLIAFARDAPLSGLTKSNLRWRVKDDQRVCLSWPDQPSASQIEAQIEKNNINLSKSDWSVNQDFFSEPKIEVRMDKVAEFADLLRALDKPPTWGEFLIHAVPNWVKTAKVKMSRQVPNLLDALSDNAHPSLRAWLEKNQNAVANAFIYGLMYKRPSYDVLIDATYETIFDHHGVILYDGLLYRFVEKDPRRVRLASFDGSQDFWVNKSYWRRKSQNKPGEREEAEKMRLLDKSNYRPRGRRR